MKYQKKIIVKMRYNIFIVMSMIIGIIQNAYVCYTKLFHFKDAKKSAYYLKKLMPDYSKAYLFIG